MRQPRLHQHLYVRIWLAVVAAIMVLTLLLGWLWHRQWERERAQRPGRELVVRNEAGDVLGRATARPVRIPGQGLEFRVVLEDGQALFVQLPRPPRPPGASGGWLESPDLQSVGGFVGVLAVVALAVALGAYPIVRRLTQRLETLQRGVERWGEGDLSVRLPVQGNDEVAFLAKRFNEAAQRVQSLVVAHKSLLANASHELRSPLARIRMGLELMDGSDANAAQRAEIARSVAELDELIGEILLASRLELTDPTATSGIQEEVDLVGLAAEECARTGATLVLPDDGQVPAVHGQAKLLRRLVRNLLENARRYGGAGADRASVQLTVQGVSGGVEIAVSDRGPGVPPEQRERIFEPFYRLPGASEREGGVGLGLSLVRTIARRHGGDARCENNPGGGARFVIFLARN
jgi:signal transduction histidine kinase